MPAATVIVLCLTLSRTLTEPRTTRVRVPAQLSCTSHFVPRTVAELYLPDVRKAPLPSPHRWRLLGFFLAVALAPFARRHDASGCASVSWVIPPVCVTLKTPS